MNSSRHLTRRQFVSSAATAAASALLPGRLAESQVAQGQAEQSSALSNSATPSSREKVAWKVQPFPLEHVRLLSGFFNDEMQVNHRWLLSLPQDRLLHSFRLTAGLPSSATPLGGWEKPDCELRGHFAGGHYLSACALAYASTGDGGIKDLANAMVAELARCQDALRTGYLSAFPEEEFDRLREGRQVWAPFYTIHKIMAGHLDAYLYCGNDQALNTAERMASWAGEWAHGIDDEHMQRILDTEFGGMAESLSSLYAVTGKQQYLDLAGQFEKRKFLDPLAQHRDELKGLHANTHIPQAIGAARRYEVTGEQRYRDIAEYFWHQVTGHRTYCNGGTSNEEHWRTDPDKLAGELSNTTVECCCAYNMMKLTRHIFGWTADPRAMDYYERVLANHRLGTQDGRGMKHYYIPLASGYWKSYNSPWDSFWCCTGTGAEEFAKFTDTIYFHDGDGIYVNLFLASDLIWPGKGVELRQLVNFPEDQGTKLFITAKQPVEMALHIRIPYWATRGRVVTLNGKPLAVETHPSSYVTINRVWKSGDRVELKLPMSLHIHPMPDDPTLQAAMYGPVVLAGRLGDSGLTEDKAYLGYDPVPKGDPIAAPTIINHSKSPAGWLTEALGPALTFRTDGQKQDLSLVPVYRLGRERYVVYWKVQNKAGASG
ncbi:MAG: beta-L-arabinofuranosidase domain-containing protein [Terriglobia bacterium]